MAGGRTMENGNGRGKDMDRGWGRGQEKEGGGGKGRGQDTGQVLGQEAGGRRRDETGRRAGGRIWYRG